MPRLTDPTKAKDPVGLIARAIIRTDELGHADTSDFVRAGAEAIGAVVSDDERERIATELFDDCGEKYATAAQMAAFIYAELTRPA